MKRTTRQNNCIHKATRYAGSSKTTEALGKLYLSYCDDGYIPFKEFSKQLKPQSNVEPIARKVNPVMPFQAFLARYESELTPKKRL